MAIKKYIKKQAKRGVKLLKKRYTKRGAPLGLNMKNIASDVARLKTLVNAEKKRTGDTYVQEFVGQVRGNQSGHYMFDISPTMITQGNDYNQRSGNSIKMHSLFLNMQVIQQADTNQNIRGVAEIWMRKQDIVTSLTAIQQLYQPTAFVTGGQPVYDLNATRNPDYFNDYVLIRRKGFRVPGDALNPSVKRTANIKIPVSFGKGIHCRWNTSGSYTDKQFLLLVRTDSGNCSTVTVAPFGRVPTNAINTGLEHGFQYEWFYYDN